MANLSNINGKFVVEQTTGYVGVGTTDPNYPIEVLNASAEIALNASGGSIYRVQSDSASNFIIRKEGVGDRLVINSAGNATFAGAITNVGSITTKATGASNSIVAQWQATNANNCATFRTTDSGYIFRIHAQNSGTIYVQNDDGSNYLKIADSGSNEILGNTTVTGTVFIDGVSNYTGLEVKGAGASRPQIKFSNVNQGVLGQIFGTEANALVTTTIAGLEYQVRNANGASGDHVFKSYNTAILTLDGGTNNATLAGNLTLSVASSFINTASGDLYINPASNNTTLYDGANAQIFNVYNAGNLAIKLNAGTGGGVLLARDGINFESAYSGNGLVLSHHGIGPSNAIVSGNSVYPDNLFINSGGAANDWSNVTIYGNVGINTPTPSRELDIQASSGWAEIALRGNTGGGGSLEFWTNTTKRAEIFADTEDIVFRNTTSNVERMRITSDGKVGINTSSFAPTISNQLKLGDMGSGAVGEVLDAGVVNGAARMIICAGGATGQVPILSLRHYSAAYGIDIWTYWASPWNTYIDNRHPSSGFIFRNNCNASGGEEALMEISGTGRISMYGLDGKTQVHPDVSYRISDGELFYQSSSIRYKKDVVNLENSLNKINALRPVRFKEKSSNEPSFGLIAEETVEVIPEVVFKKEIEGFDEEQIEGVSYSNLVPFLIKAIQELKADNDSLKARIETLENN